MLPALIAEHADAIDKLCRDHNVRRLEVFGSAATGQWDPQRSDLDFIVDFGENSKVFAQVELQQALAELFGHEVDLISDHDYKNPYFRRSVEASRTHLWGEPRISRPVNGGHVHEHPALKYLWELREECDFLDETVSTSNLDDVLDNRALSRAVLQSLTRIGEQLNVLSRKEPDIAGRMTDPRGYVRQRNIIVHAYYDIDWDLIWHAVAVETPLIMEEVEALIAELDVQNRD